MRVWGDSVVEVDRLESLDFCDSIPGARGAIQTGVSNTKEGNAVNERIPNEVLAAWTAYLTAIRANNLRPVPFPPTSTGSP